MKSNKHGPERNSDSDFLESIEHGEIKADARVLRQGRRVSDVDCDVTDQDGRLVGKALMTFAIISPKQKGKFQGQNRQSRV